MNIFMSGLKKRGTDMLKMMHAIIKVLLLVESYTQGQSPELTITPNPVEIGSNLTVICETINGDIKFFVDEVQKGRCPHPIIEESCTPNEIKKNTTAGVTSWTLEASLAHQGSWKCSQSGVDSLLNVVGIYKCPDSILSESGITSHLTLNESSKVTVSVKVDCVYPTNNTQILLQIKSVDFIQGHTEMDCYTTSDTCPAGSAYECTKEISYNMTKVYKPLLFGKNYTLHVVAVPSLGTCPSLSVFSPYTVKFTGQSVSDGLSCDVLLILVNVFLSRLLPSCCSPDRCL